MGRDATGKALQPDHAEVVEVVKLLGDVTLVPKIALMKALAVLRITNKALIAP